MQNTNTCILRRKLKKRKEGWEEAAIHRAASLTRWLVSAGRTASPAGSTLETVPASLLHGSGHYPSYGLFHFHTF